MKTKLSFTLLISLIFNFSIQFLSAQNVDKIKYWPQWRGPLGTGAAINENLPVQFNENENQKWKIEISGKGHATPIVWGNNIVIQTSVATNQAVEKNADAEDGGEDRSWMQASKTNKIHEFKVLLLNRENREIKWKKTGDIEWQTLFPEDEQQFSELHRCKNR